MTPYDVNGISLMEQSSNVGKDFDVAALSWHSDRREVFLDQNFPVFVSLEWNSIG